MTPDNDQEQGVHFKDGSGRTTHRPKTNTSGNKVADINRPNDTNAQKKHSTYS